MKTSILFCLAIVILYSCQSTKSVSQDSMIDDTVLKQKANELATEFLITDGHVDLPYRLKVRNFKLEKEYLGIPIETTNGDFDYVRAKKGGLDAPFMSIYLPANRQEEKGASKKLADSLINMVEGIAAAHSDKFVMAHTADDCMKVFEKGLIALPMGMENGSGLEDDISNVQYFNDRGISYITLTHSRDNLICDSSYDTTGTWGGLSPYGKEVVKEMNRVGVMVDISHVSDETFYDVMKITKVPVIASHSPCRKFTPDFERNMSDEMIRRLGENGGVIQINFGSSFLDREVQKNLNASRRELRKLMEERNLSFGDEQAMEVIRQFQKDNPVLLSDVEMVANHVDHVVKVAGVDHVGFGSDFDGVGDTLPTGLKDVSQFPNLIYVLLKKGYSEEDIEKICYKNVFRVWRAVDQYALRS